MQQQQQHPAPGAEFVADRDAARAEVERALGGYSFRDGGALLLEDALTHSVHPRDEAGGRARHQRLEFLGDAALGLAFATIFYRDDPGLDQGDLTVLRSANVSTQKLARVAVRRRLYPLLRRYNCAPQDHEIPTFPESPFSSKKSLKSSKASKRRSSTVKLMEWRIKCSLGQAACGVESSAPFILFFRCLVIY